MKHLALFITKLRLSAWCIRFHYSRKHSSPKFDKHVDEPCRFTWVAVQTAKYVPCAYELKKCIAVGWFQLHVVASKFSIEILLWWRVNKMPYWCNYRQCPEKKSHINISSWHIILRNHIIGDRINLYHAHRWIFPSNEKLWALAPTTGIFTVNSVLQKIKNIVFRFSPGFCEIKRLKNEWNSIIDRENEWICNTDGATWCTISMDNLHGSFGLAYLIACAYEVKKLMHR